MTSERFEPENLVVLDRRGQLDAEQANELDRLYREHGRTTELYNWGRAFDEEDLVQTGDELLLARSVEQALRNRRLHSATLGRRKKPRVGGWLLAAILIGSSVAAAGTAGVVGLLHRKAATNETNPILSTGVTRVQVPANKHVEQPKRVAADAAPIEATHPASTRSDPPNNPKNVAVAPAQNQERREPSVGSASLPSTLAQHQERREPSVEPEPRPVAHITEPAPETAAELFRLASDARRQGNMGLCIRRYRELQERFGGSAEAQQSHVSLGRVLQSNGDVAGAVREFTLYLERPGALEEEALVGRAEGLGVLGRNAEERATWQRLLERFGGSVYAPRARQRLASPR